jgi:hypothetical protein
MISWELLKRFLMLGALKDSLVAGHNQFRRIRVMMSPAAILSVAIPFRQWNPPSLAARHRA